MLTLLFLTTMGCSRDAIYGGTSLTENLEESFKDCDEKEISYLARKNNIQTAFENCGSNYFNHFRWSPSGLLLYFQLFQGAYILNGETQSITALPITRPSDNAVWISEGQLILPNRQEDETLPEQINIYNSGGFLDSFQSPIKEPRHFHRGESLNEILLSGIGEDNIRRPYKVDLKSREASEIFTFHKGAIDEFQYSQEAKLLTITTNKHLWVYKDEKLLFELDDINRAVPHPDGLYIALEVEGKPILPIEKDVLGSLDPAMQERDELRRQQKAEELPDWMPKEIIPPEIHIISMRNLERYRIGFFFGEKISWYEAERYYISFYMRGIETHMLNVNVALTDLSIPLYALDKGETSAKAERVEPITLLKAD